MNGVESETLYYIFMDSGESLYLLGNDGKYETDIRKAISFDNKLDALIFVEKHGYERIAFIRELLYSKR